MNSNTAVMVAQEVDGIKPFGSRKKHKSKLNANLCPELEMIGRHIVENGKCRYCKVEIPT